MPNVYKRVPGKRNYRNFSDESLNNALSDVKNKKLSMRQASSKYGIPLGTISRKYNDKNTKKVGGQIALLPIEENILVDTILFASDWGYPFEKDDVKYLVKSYLDRAGKQLKPFKNNLPGDNWYHNFIKRHSTVLKTRLGENIKRSRAAVSRTTINEYFDSLEISLLNVPSQNIINYDETNFSDDPGRNKVLVRKSSKHADTIMDSSKSATSVMFAVDASGKMLPPYVVYKSSQLWNSWTTGGPEMCRYNRTLSGWFDQSVFEDWFITVIIPYCRRLDGVKAIIGDNLASHVSVKIVQLCQKHNIRFIFLPPNSTHLTQPLDVSCFRPMKIAWRKVLKAYKRTQRGPIAKEIFPRLLKKTLNKLSITQSDNIKSGFEATGLYPLNREKVLNKLPPDELDGSNASTIIPQTLHDLFKENRFGKKDETKGRRKKYNIQPGRSVTEDNLLGGNYEDTRVNNFDIIDNITETERENMTEEEIISERENKTEEEIMTGRENVTEKKTDTEKKMTDPKFIKVDDFVKAQFKTIKGTFQEYIGQVCEISGTEYNCRFLRKNIQLTGFYCFPFVMDEAIVSCDEIIKKLTVIQERRGNYRFE